ELLTRRPEDADNYYRRIAQHPAARAVKVSDILDNTRPERVARLDSATARRLTEKYTHALEQLGEPWPIQRRDRHVGGSQFGSPRLYADQHGEEHGGDGADEENDEDRDAQ